MTVQVPADVGTDATAAWVNVTATNGCRAGYLTAGACGAASDTSTTNYGPGESRPGLALVPLDAEGRFCVRASTCGDVAVDLFAVQGAAGAGGGSCRRRRNGWSTRAAACAGGGRRSCRRRRRCSGRVDGRVRQPDRRRRVRTDVRGDVPGGRRRFVLGRRLGRHVQRQRARRPAPTPTRCWSGWAAAGGVCVIAGQPRHVVVDRTGAIGAAGTGPVTASRRLLDTRGSGAALTARSVVTVATGGGADQPVLLNLTATDAGAPGYLAVVPPVGAGCPAAGGDGTSTSTVNVTPGRGAGQPRADPHRGRRPGVRVHLRPDPRRRRPRRLVTATVGTSRCPRATQMCQRSWGPALAHRWRRRPMCQRFRRRGRGRRRGPARRWTPGARSSRRARRRARPRGRGRCARAAPRW